MAYPTTAQEMVDRLLVDRAFLIRTVVTDNYQAVRANYIQQLEANAALVDSPEKLTAKLVWWDRYHGSELVDPVLDVNYRGAAQSRVLNDAMAQLRDVQRQSGAAPKGNFLTDGIAALVGAVGGVVNGQAAIDAQQNIATQQLTNQAANDAASNARKATLLKWGIGIAAVVVVVLVVIYFKNRA